MRGQALVEFALIVPLALAMFLGMTDCARYGMEEWTGARAAAVIADYAAAHEDPSPIVTDELTRAGCASATVDTDSEPGVVIVTVRCAFSPFALPLGDVTATASAVSWSWTP